ncbi:PEP-CTERM sorting domain-containing protein [Hydrogenophaga sp.]|uniref:Npun_F0296 family exosortase-dependent surface protein n=1 Tax=Hydrogenophaga sp. TaxID=1904254 RepID=UPI00271AB49A|nr:PEP-CTERM sorting domain-containing protein [Hydrogenophaga sp.]MDO9136046.1 PEP-CTERM sorting domain-containing protein [Hydrogenophaga sp.]
MTSFAKIALASALVVSMGAAFAAPSVFSSVGGAPTGVNKWNLDSMTLPVGTGLGSIVVTPNASYVTGSTGGINAAPVLSGNNGVGFGAGGSNQANGTNLTQYLTTGSTNVQPGSNIVINFTADQFYFGLLWGSVDPGNGNTMEFFNKGLSMGTLNGDDVTPTATGNQGASGTYYVNIDLIGGFDQIVFKSTSYAFEFDNIAWSANRAVPEPGSLALLGLGLAGLGFARRRRAA